MLLLGIIPVIEAKDIEGYDLFEGLPVVHVPNVGKATSKEDFVDAIQSYINSDAFQKTSFDKGWESLFLQSRRQQLLKDTGRKSDIVVDGRGREHYRAFQCSVTNPGGHNQHPVFCSKGGM